MTAFVGVAGNIGTVYSETDMLQGKAPGDGTKGAATSTTTGQLGTQEFLMCKVATAQNVIKGNLVTIAADFTCTLSTATAPSGVTRAQLGVAVCTVTASASSHIWCQIYGRGQVIASVSCEPNVLVAAGAVAGQVDDTAASASAAITGLWTTASTGAATGLVACVLNYPEYVRG